MAPDWWKHRRVLVTGGAGFIGSNLVARLVREEAQVRVVDNLERGRQEYLAASQNDIEFLHGDLKSVAVCESACHEVDVVFHLASKVGGIRYYMDRAGDVFRENTLMDHNMWSAAIRANVPYYFYASSAHVYPGNLQQSPDSPLIREEQAYPASPELSYGWAKLIGEQLIQYTINQGDCNTRAAIARIIGSYGPNQDLDLATGSCIPVFCRRAIRYPDEGPFRVLGTGAETRSYHFVSDTIDAFLLSVQKLEGSLLVGPFNLGSEERISIGDLAREVIAVSGKRIDIDWDTSHRTLIWGQAVACDLASDLLDGWKHQVSLHDGLSICYKHISDRLRT
ncbi:putative UDP-glucose 4-epimerase [Candidatus Sulfotelmatomonas gaucii]|uniref:Putative UDP-glucose 4-epimerase n=1 Tax=Candidatus Sulfuritelmatomonas gaucii TaxID=2043161 RepID=A0A2N9MA03_9BACT|nr:putative UDP-glucose 4-epimerase [Candidatus Sulfotelmatomonas gaucii]